LLKRLPKPGGDFHLFKGIHIQADSHIVPPDPGVALPLFEYPVVKSNGAAAELKHADFHFDIIPITKRTAEIRLQMDGGKADAVVSTTA
jgi:hypothetical protein